VNQPFTKVHQFDIDCNLLFKEWHDIASKQQIFADSRTYLLLLITYPSSYNQDIDIAKFQNTIGVDNFYNISSEFSVRNIVKDFKNTYTEHVAQKVSEYIETSFSNYNTTIIKYAAQPPNCRMRTHVDTHPNSMLPRFLLAVNAKHGSIMEVDGCQYPLDEQGSLFMLDRTVAHSPINQSNDYRLLMHFDVKQI